MNIRESEDATFLECMAQTSNSVQAPMDDQTGTAGRHGTIPRPHAANWGYGLNGVLWVILIVLVVLMLLGSL